MLGLHLLEIHLLEPNLLGMRFACWLVGPDLSAYGVDPVFKSGTDLYNADLDNEADTVSFYNCSTLGYDATYNIPNTDTSLTVSIATWPKLQCSPRDCC